MEPEYDITAANERMYELKIKARDAIDAMGAELERHSKTVIDRYNPAVEWTVTRLEAPMEEYIAKFIRVLRFEETLRDKVAAWLVEKQRQHTSKHD
jgi:hypothetical protein